MNLFLIALTSFFVQNNSPTHVITVPEKTTPKLETADSLLPIQYRNRWGFINTQGQVLIEPKFRNIGSFSENLCPARLNGTYGYIDPGGEFVLPPQYDYASSFSEGLARVYQNGKVAFIDPSGKKPWPLEVHDASSFDGGKAEVIFKNGDSTWTGFLDKTGTITIPEPTEVWTSTEGLSIANRPYKNPEGYTRSMHAVLDSATGRVIVPYGVYKNINVFTNGFAEVWLTEQTNEKGQISGFINRKGELLFTLPKGSFTLGSDFSEGLIAIHTDKQPQEDGHWSGKSYITWYDTTGKIQLVMPEIEKALPFSNGRALVGKIRNWRLIDRSGKPLSNNRFVWIKDPDFSKNLILVAAYPSAEQQAASKKKRSVLNEIVESMQSKLMWSGSNEKWGAIDSMGEYIFPPQFDKLVDKGFQPEGLLVALADGRSRESYRWGLIDEQGNYRFQPKFTKVSESGFKHGLLFAELDSLYGYVNTSGEFVWSAVREKAGRSLEALNTATMLRGYLYGYRAEYNLPKAYRDDKLNRAQPIGPRQLPQGQLGILVLPEQVDTFQQHFKGMTTLVYNTSSDTIQIDVQDSRLYIIMQALDASGTWKDIEYSSSSWCGNSYYTTPLAPQEYWKLVIPVYEGDISTTLRLAFTWRTDSFDGKTKAQTLFSNTFPGSINPGQFWNTVGYMPSGLMDPYLD